MIYIELSYEAIGFFIVLIGLIVLYFTEFDEDNYY